MTNLLPPLNVAITSRSDTGNCGRDSTTGLRTVAARKPR